jgi:hypothetical protein
MSTAVDKQRIRMKAAIQRAIASQQKFASLRRDPAAYKPRFQFEDWTGEIRAVPGFDECLLTSTTEDHSLSLELE